MPITIKSTELKYKNPSTGNYQGIDAVAETTTSQQCALIEAKGIETRATIPSDYTTLSDNVTALNSAINEEKFRMVMLSDGTAIAANSNFNTITTCGTYYVASTAIAQTILNIPIPKGGRLIVNEGLAPNTTYKSQIYIPYYGANIFFRNTSNGGTAWGVWRSTSTIEGGLTDNYQKTATASKNYTAGEYLFYENQFYKVTNAITSGTSITGKITACTVGSELTSIRCDDRYAAGDSFTDGWLYCVGVISNGGKRIVVKVDMNKAIGNLTFTPSKIELYLFRDDNVPVMSTYYDATQYLYSCTKYNEYSLNIRLEKNDGWGVNYATPVTGELIVSGSFS